MSGYRDSDFIMGNAIGADIRNPTNNDIHCLYLLVKVNGDLIFGVVFIEVKNHCDRWQGSYFGVNAGRGLSIQ